MFSIGLFLPRVKTVDELFPNIEQIWSLVKQRFKNGFGLGWISGLTSLFQFTSAFVTFCPSVVALLITLKVEFWEHLMLKFSYKNCFYIKTLNFLMTKIET